MIYLLPFEQAWDLLKSYYISRQNIGTGGTLFTLHDYKGKPLSSVSADSVDLEHNNELTDINGQSFVQRQGNYGKLLNALIQAGHKVHSNYRNDMSDPFHRKFMRNLPPNVRFRIDKDNPNYQSQDIYYSKRPKQEYFGDSKLARFDYGSIPIHEAEPIGIGFRFGEQGYVPQSKLTDFGYDLGSMSRRNLNFRQANSADSLRNRRYAEEVEGMRQEARQQMIEDGTIVDPQTTLNMFDQQV